jgi:hypothetical protein
MAAPGGEQLALACCAFAFRSRTRRTMRQALPPPRGGDLTLRYERLSVDGDPGLEIYAYLAEPGSPSADAFNFLASYSDGSRAARADRHEADDKS